ncbi:MAG: hypothetical protein ABR521_06800 [Gaiellaceae bacterium]
MTAAVGAAAAAAVLLVPAAGFSWPDARGAATASGSGTITFVESGSGTVTKGGITTTRSFEYTDKQRVRRVEWDAYNGGMTLYLRATTSVGLTYIERSTTHSCRATASATTHANAGTYVELSWLGAGPAFVPRGRYNFNSARTSVKARVRGTCGPETDGKAFFAGGGPLPRTYARERNRRPLPRVERVGKDAYRLRGSAPYGDAAPSFTNPYALDSSYLWEGRVRTKGTFTWDITVRGITKYRR